MTTRRTTRPRERRFGSLIMAVAAATTLGCGGGEETPATDGGTTDVGAGLLASKEALTAAPADRAISAAPENPEIGLAEGAEPERRTFDISELGFDTGTRGAPVRIVEFSDFGCGYCKKFHEETYPTLVEQYIDLGKVEWKYIPMVIGLFGPNAEVAALAGECAGAQGHFPEMRDGLFAAQAEWKPADDPLPILRRIAEASGVDLARWDRCVADREPRDRILAGTQLGFQAGVRGTPTFFLVGYMAIPGALPLDLFQEVLDTVLVEAGRAGGQPESR